MFESVPGTNKYYARNAVSWSRKQRKTLMAPKLMI